VDRELRVEQGKEKVMQLHFKAQSLAGGAIVVGALLLSAQGPEAGQHREMRMYDPSTETTFKGAVEEVTGATPGAMMDHGAMGNDPMKGDGATSNGMMGKGMMGGGGMMGTHLVVKTGDENRTVMLGPPRFIANRGFAFVKGDTVEITGSKVKMGGSEHIVARQVVKDGKTLTLRDKTGTPEWAGGGMMKGRGGATPKQ
jgi:hypothetical protein